MNSVLKTLGLALIAALAIGALASSAQALEFTTESEEYPAELHGEGAAGNDVFETEGGPAECASTYSGSLGEASSTVELHPDYSECQAFGFVSATVDTEGCNYLMHLQSEYEENAFETTADIVCGEGESIKITAASCAIEYGPQENLSAFTFHLDIFPKVKLTIKAALNSLEYTVTKDGFLCPFSGTGEREGGELTTNELVTLGAEPLVHIG